MAFEGPAVGERREIAGGTRLTVFIFGAEMGLNIAASLD